MAIPCFTAASSIYGSSKSYWSSAKDYSSNSQSINSQMSRVISSEIWKIPEPAESGRRAWIDLERACYNLQCKECRKDCSSFINGLHDAVNIKLGKPMRTPNDFVYLREFINSMSENAFI